MALFSLQALQMKQQEGIAHRPVELASLFTVCSVKHKAHSHVYFKAAHCLSLSTSSSHLILTHILALQLVGWIDRQIHILRVSRVTLLMKERLPVSVWASTCSACSALGFNTSPAPKP